MWPSRKARYWKIIKDHRIVPKAHQKRKIRHSKDSNGLDKRSFTEKGSSKQPSAVKSAKQNAEAMIQKTMCLDPEGRPSRQIVPEINKRKMQIDAEAEALSKVIHHRTDEQKSNPLHPASRK